MAPTCPKCQSDNIEDEVFDYAQRYLRLQNGGLGLFVIGVSSLTLALTLDNRIWLWLATGAMVLGAGAFVTVFFVDVREMRCLDCGWFERR